MLSFGQLQERLIDSPQTNYISRLLVTHASDSECIHLYETEVSSTILRMLDNPSTASAVGWPIIQRRTISFKPFETFMHRLVRTLLEPNTL
jgi:hypothetical protein